MARRFMSPTRVVELATGMTTVSLAEDAAEGIA
jgi:hypothetical protein